MAGRSYRYAPWAFRRFEAYLLRAEQYWRGGEENRGKDEIAKQSAEFSQQLANARVAGVVPRSLTALAAAGKFTPLPAKSAKSSLRN